MKLMVCFVMMFFFACDSGSEIFESQGVMSVDYGRSGSASIRLGDCYRHVAS